MDFQKKAQNCSSSKVKMLDIEKFYWYTARPTEALSAITNFFWWWCKGDGEQVLLFVEDTANKISICENLPADALLWCILDFYAMMPDAMHISHESKYPACLQLQTEAAGAIVWEYFGRLWSVSMFFILFSVKESSNPQALSYKKILHGIQWLLYNSLAVYTFRQ